MRRPLVAGNWKMNGSLSSVRDLLVAIKANITQVSRAEIVVCPPAIFLPETQSLLQDSPISWGGQDLSIYDSGAYTGEISGPMFQDFGCKYIIVGHSERRTYHKESNALVAEKFAAAVKFGLIPIFCVGETLEQRESGATEDIVAQQVDAVVEHGSISLLGQGVIAYEPVWAIGTGRTATPDQAQDVHNFIRQRIANYSQDVAQSVRILYGGSMKPGNAGELLAKADIDGGLIGGASLNAADFLAIGMAAN
ncbi:triosephosphate isomerase [Achromatium sp. WMS2]|nr:triosephosphate isomerase [Achromatium sp. WMS2]